MASKTEWNGKSAMRLNLPAAVLITILACPPAWAQSGGSLFGSPERVPANPFASNYPSAAPSRSDTAYERSPHGDAKRHAVRPRRAEPLHPPRDIPQ